MNISIVIPNYNGEELLRRNLAKVFDAVRPHKDVKVEVIIVDDGSTDGSKNFIASQILNPKSQSVPLRLIENEKRLGFSSAINRGVGRANGEIVVLLNTDVVPQKGFLEPLLQHFEDPFVFAVGCLDKSIEKGRVVVRGRGIGKFQRGFLVHARGEVNKHDTLWVSGGSGVFRKSTWKALGGFDTLYNPFYWEDIDLSYRAIKSGYKIFFEPKSIVIHEHEGGSIKKHYKDFQIRIVSYRNQFIFVWKNITDLDKQFLHILWLPYHFLKAFLRGDFYFFIGFFLAVVKLPYIIKESFSVQKLFIKPDRAIIG